MLGEEEGSLRPHRS
jgi:hypothetical protein